MFPRSKTWTRSGATGATLFSMAAVIGPKFLFDMERLEAPLNMVVSDYVVWTTDYASCAPRAQARGDHLFVEFHPQN